MVSFLDKIYAYYFMIHIPISLLVDSAIAVPPEWWLPFQKTLAGIQINDNKDALFAARPIWLQSFVWVEILIQVPFFAWAAGKLLQGNERVWVGMVIYGIEAAITTFACLIEVFYLEGLTRPEHIKLIGLYLPTFIIPLIIAGDFASRINSRLGAKAKTD